MSNRRKPKRTRRPAPTPGPGEAYCTQLAVVADRHVTEDVEAARQMTHDTLIESLGDRRRSGVWWTDYAAHAGLSALEDLMPDDGTEQVRQVRQNASAMLKASESLLVVAWTLAVIPEGVTF